jgi:uncharacterized protein
VPESKKKVTLIGAALAEVGTEFVYDGPALACEDCPLMRACVNLEKGKRYEIVAKRPTQHVCRIHHGNVCAVEVMEAPVCVYIRSDEARPNTTIMFRHPCSQDHCEQYALCNPEGILVGQKYIIIDRYDEFFDTCPQGEKRARVKLISLPDELPRISG